MRFEDILGNGRLWAVVYDGEEADALSELEKMEKVRNYLLSQGAHDLESFEEMIKEDDKRRQR